MLKESLQGLEIWVELFLMKMTWKILSLLTFDLPLGCLFPKFSSQEEISKSSWKKTDTSQAGFKV